MATRAGNRWVTPRYRAVGLVIDTETTPSLVGLDAWAHGIEQVWRSRQRFGLIEYAPGFAKPAAVDTFDRSDELEAALRAALDDRPGIRTGAQRLEVFIGCGDDAFLYGLCSRFRMAVVPPRAFTGPS
jgi:hypothetical protein